MSDGAMRATGPVVLVIMLTVLSGFGAHLAEERNARLFGLHHRLAQEGDLKSATVVGSLYLQGIGVLPDFEKAVYWYERGGPVGGWEMLGTVFQYREPPSYARAAFYYRKAAELCSAIALYELGALESDGRLGPPNSLDAYTWIGLARWAATRTPGCRQHVSCRDLALEDRPERVQSLRRRLTAAQIVDSEARMEQWKRLHPWPRGDVRCAPSASGS